MHLHESGEMYLETIYVLSQKSSLVRSIDVGEEMGFSKPSVSRAVNLLKDNGYLTVEANGGLILTESGLAIATKIYERHTILSRLLIEYGVNPEIAAADACKMEHIISDETFDCIKSKMREHNLL